MKFSKNILYFVWFFLILICRFSVVLSADVSNGNEEKKNMRIFINNFFESESETLEQSFSQSQELSHLVYFLEN